MNTHIQCRGYKWAELCRHSFTVSIEWTALSVLVDISALFLPLWEFWPIGSCDVCCKRLRMWSSDAVDCFRWDLAAAERLSAKSNSDTVRHPSHSAGSRQTDRHTNKTSHPNRTGSWIGVWHSSWNCRLTTNAARCCQYFRCSFYRQHRRHRSSAILKRHNRAAQRCDAESQEHSIEHRANQRLPWDMSQRASARYDPPFYTSNFTRY